MGRQSVGTFAVVLKAYQNDFDMIYAVANLPFSLPNSKTGQKFSFKLLRKFSTLIS